MYKSPILTQINSFILQLVKFLCRNQSCIRRGFKIRILIPDGYRSQDLDPQHWLALLVPVCYEAVFSLSYKKIGNMIRDVFHPGARGQITLDLGSGSATLSGSKYLNLLENIVSCTNQRIVPQTQSTKICLSQIFLYVQQSASTNILVRDG